MRDLLRRAFVENAALKVVALILSVTLFIVVNGERDAMVGASIRVVYTLPEDRVLLTEPLDEVRVTVRGPWTRIKRFDKNEIDPIYIDLSKLPSGEFIFQEDLFRLPAGLKLASVNPPSVRFEFDRAATRVVPVEVVLEGDPARGYRVEKAVSHPSEVNVRGARKVVDSIVAVQTRRLSVTGRSGTFRERVLLAPTEEHTSVVGLSEIEAEVSLVEEGRDLSLAGIAVLAKGADGVALPGLAKLGLSPGVVAVTVRGARALVDKIVPSQVTARVDVLAEDLASRQKRKAKVVVDGLPPGVAVEIVPAEITLEPR